MTPVISAGGVVYRQTDDGIEFLMIRDRFGRWTLPKGHLEAGESAEEAAIREIREETGIDGRLEGDLPSSTYHFHDRGNLMRKTVRYFLVKALGGEAVPQEGEVVEVRWFPMPAVASLRQYDNNRPVIEEAVRQLSS